MTPPRISVLIGSSNRPEALRRCVKSAIGQDYPNFEILILDNSPHINSCDHLLEICDHELVQSTHINESRGVSGSRNWLMKNATGDIFVVIDDDAYFETENELDSIAGGFESEIGIQAFKIVDHSEGGERILAPLPKAESKDQELDEPFYTSYYVGGGHAIRREVIEECGYYNDDLVYGGEELDLSYRAIESGFEIKYNPDVVVQHFSEPPVIDVSDAHKSELHYLAQNRLYLPYRYLPWKYVPSSLLVWLSYLAVVAAKQRCPLSYLRGILGGIRLCLKTDRTPLSPSAEKYLKENHGRLWY